MGSSTGIEWTDSTWSPIRVRVKENAAEIADDNGYRSLVSIAGKMAGRVGPHCEPVSHGCDHCYAETNNHRCLPGNGTGLPYDRRSRDLVDIFIDEKVLIQPLKWRAAKHIFVENQSDLFGEWVPDESIDRVFAAIALDYDMHWTEHEGNVRQPHHTFQVLTKRPERMLAYMSRIIEANKGAIGNWFDLPLVKQAVNISQSRGDPLPGNASIPVVQWVEDGMPGLWLGVSCEDQKTADERIPLLLRTPSAVRFISYEPALGRVDLKPGLWIPPLGGGPKANLGCPWEDPLPSLDWIIVGGESGPGARPMDIAWVRSIAKQCADSGTPCFIKQLGAKPHSIQDRISHRGDTLPKPEGFYRCLNDRKGGDIEEFPQDLRVREFPKGANA